MAITRRSTAIWNGPGKEGHGTLSSTSGVLKDTPYSAGLRFGNEDGKAGTNPEELIAAAHAGCFAMALSFALAGAGFPPDELKTTAHVSIDKVPDGYEVTGIVLDLAATVPGVSDTQFQQLAEGAKQGCPISKLLKSVPITLNAKLNS